MKNDEKGGFAALQWYDWLQYVAMIFMAAAVPVSMNIGVLGAVALAVASVVRLCATRRMTSFSRPVRLALYAPIAYWLCILVGALLGSDRATGLGLVWMKIPLAVFPLCFLLTDMTYVRGVRLRLLFYALWASCLGVFIYFCGVAAGRMANGSTLATVTNASFDTRHHAYVALYAVSAMAFVYMELRNHWSELRPWLRWVLVGSVPLLATYIILVNSRAGMLVMWAVVALAAVDSVRRCWWKTLIVTALLAGYIVGIGALLPGHTNRVKQTVEAIVGAAGDGEGKDGDVRITITRSALHSAAQSPLVGYGTGNYRDSLAEQYNDDGFESGGGARYNAHNQYVESQLSTGIVGLLTLLCFIFAPLAVALFRARQAVLPTLFATGIVAGNLLVESMLEREMGILFIGYFMTIMVLIVSEKENKFGHMAKK